MKIRLLLCLVAIGFAFTATAQEATDRTPAPELSVEDSGNELGLLDFALGLGYNYRRFHKVRQYARTTGGYGGYSYVPGSGLSSFPLTVLNGVPRDEEELDGRSTVYLGRGEFGMAESLGWELNLVLPFFRRDRLQLDAALGFQFYELDTQVTSGGYRSSFDFQMHTYDIGVKAAYCLFDNFDLTASIGPSFNLIDMESRSGGDCDDATRVEVGAFGSVGAQYWLCSWLGLSAQLRYDDVFSDASTRYSRMKLDTWNTDFRLIFLF